MFVLVLIVIMVMMVVFVVMLTMSMIVGALAMSRSMHVVTARMKYLHLDQIEAQADQRHIEHGLAFDLHNTIDQPATGLEQKPRRHEPNTEY